MRHADDGKEYASRAVESREMICAAAIEIILATYANGLRAVVLTGSLARDEATFIGRSGALELLGDADFLLVYEPGVPDLDAATEEALSRSIEKSLLRLGIRGTVHAHAVFPKYFRALRPTIFSYELKRCGRVVWGDARVLESIPDFSAADISREDAWRLLCNRIVEHLAFVGDLSNVQAELNPQLHYATVKLVLDMATSYLVFAGQYVPGYRARSERLLALASQPNDHAPFPLGKFVSHVKDCTSWKLSGDEECCERGVERWQEAISYMRRLWRWEMIQLTNARGALTVADLSNRLARQQSAKQRLRGWLSLVKRRGWLRSAAQWPRWMRMAFHSTPRYSVYQAATEVAFRLPCLVKHGGQPPRLDVNWHEIRKSLPESSPQSNSENGALWRKVVNDVLWNYSEFLERTDA
jgi:predicted nucleotidyltransferase